MFVYMVHKDTKGSTYVPDDPDVIKSHEARGWVKAEEPAQEIFVPKTVEPEAGQWVELHHPESGGVQLIPNNADALAGALEAGWQAPKVRVRDEPATPEREANADSEPLQPGSRAAPAPSPLGPTSS